MILSPSCVAYVEFAYQFQLLECCRCSKIAGEYLRLEGKIATLKVIPIHLQCENPPKTGVPFDVEDFADFFVGSFWRFCTCFFFWEIARFNRSCKHSCCCWRVIWEVQKHQQADQTLSLESRLLRPTLVKEGGYGDGDDPQVKGFLPQLYWAWFMSLLLCPLCMDIYVYI